MNKQTFVALAACFCVLLIGTALGVWLLHQAELESKKVRDDVVQCSKCLPQRLTLNTQFSESPEVVGPGMARRVITVEQKLIQLKAHCVSGIIYDGNGKEIVFVPWPEWGFPPTKEMEKSRQRLSEEIDQLAKNHSVIIMLDTHAPV